MVEQRSAETMALYLARKLFSLADEADDKAQRIEFKGGKWPDNETTLGGLSEAALAAVLATFIRTHGTTP